MLTCTHNDIKGYFCFCQKSNLNASTGVLGTPLNMLEPERPGKNSESHLGSSKQSWMNPAGFIPSGYKSGQNGDDTHWGTTSVALALVFWACLRTLGIKYTGGHSQLLSSAQLHVNASTASVPGSQNWELKQGTCLFSELANLSTVCGPHLASKMLKTPGFNKPS